MADAEALARLIADFPPSRVQHGPGTIIRCFFEGSREGSAIAVNVDTEPGRDSYEVMSYSLLGSTRVSLQAALTLLSLVDSFLERLEAIGYWPPFTRPEEKIQKPRIPPVASRPCPLLTD